MRKPILVWGSRTFALILVVLAANHWGPPLYKQYFTTKKKMVYVPTGQVKQGKFTVSFHEIGTMEAEKSVPVNTETGGKIITLVQDGKIVKTGEQIAVLDTTDLEREVRNQRLSYKNAQADVDRAKAEQDILVASNKTELDKADAQMKFDQTELDRSKTELDKKKRQLKEKLIRQSDVDQAEFDVRSKDLTILKGQKDLTLKQADCKSKEEQKKADVRNREFAAEMAKQSLDDAQSKMKSAIIKAPASGLVVISKDWTPDGRRKLQEGDSVHPREMLCSLPDLASMQTKVQVGESDAPKVRVDMPALIRLEAVPNRIFHGTIKEISSLATEAMPWETGSTPGRKNFEVIIAIKEVDPKLLKPGMTADVEFVRDELKTSMYVPLESVVERETKTFVFTKSGKKWVRTQVKTGKQNDNFICITKGLKAGQVIALRDPTRPLEEQEAGANVPGGEEKGPKKAEKKKPAPIPAVVKH